MKEQVYLLMKKYAEMMIEQSKFVGSSPMLLFKTDEAIYATKAGADFLQLNPDHIEIADVSRAEVQFLKTEREMNALVIPQTPFCQRCLKEGKEIRAVLDDMAQIIGPRARIIDGTFGSLQKALKGSAGCLVKDGFIHETGYTVTAGRNLYEAVVAMTVLEKSAEVFLKAEVLGGGKPINPLEVKLMRRTYKKKYSKAEQTVKAKEGKDSPS